VLPSGELSVVRANGQRVTLGVRWLQQYYKQNATAIDERESVKVKRWFLN
jgi:hypothetical protein